SVPFIDYHSQGDIWVQQRPVLFIFGTAHGLSSEVIERCNYLLLPIKGLTTYNHLSVRSAAAIIFDRWFGLNQKL
ncbi:RNA methyltransferase, partial [Candidatus Dependentiae bacterium]|nr:RNA methyltransferase [Candidatus Dependentiae bacterium]